MNEFVNEVMIKRVERTMKALEAHCMNPMFVKTREEALMLVKSMLSEGDKIGVGGSVTLNEVGIMQEQMCIRDRYSYYYCNAPLFR